ncbi:hypothetical protein F7725_005579 [Dissostichus mawsoni]|uniref:Uncharacterized protein n=1 Tax=Dissostichus mawsoni TaxID=36200 RepID=A0A7J5YRN9_DISMA|nr:hypothetical protein F7725_005579 [Dissostichus mawsoni]
MLLRLPPTFSPVIAKGALNHCSKVMQLLNMVGSRKLSSAQSSGSLFCSARSCEQYTPRGQVVCVQNLGQLTVVVLHPVALVHNHPVSPRVHLQPGLQLSGSRSVHSCQDLPAVHVDDLHRKVTHLTRLIQRLQGGTKGLRSFVSSDQIGEVGHVLVSLLQQVGQALILLLPPHPLFLNTLVLFLLLPLSVGVVGGHCFCQLLHFACNGAVVLFEVFGVLQDAVQFLCDARLSQRLMLASLVGLGIEGLKQSEGFELNSSFCTQVTSQRAWQVLQLSNTMSDPSLISTGSRPQGFWMGVMRFCLVWKGIMGVGCAGWPGDWVCGGITGEAAGGTEGGAGEGRPPASTSRNQALHWLLHPRHRPLPLDSHLEVIWQGLTPGQHLISHDLGSELVELVLVEGSRATRTSRTRRASRLKARYKGRDTGAHAGSWTGAGGARPGACSPGRIQRALAGGAQREGRGWGPSYCERSLERALGWGLA